jgi:menaquinone-specific isochorismate synthase
MTLVRTVAIPDPGDLLALLPDEAPLAWIRHGDGIVGWGEAHRIEVGTGDGRFAAADAALRAWFDAATVVREVGGPGTGPVAFGSFTFDWHTGGSTLVVPRVVVGRRDSTCWVTVTGDAPPDLPAPQPLPAGTRVRYAGATISEVAWLEAVARAAGSVRNGRLSKVVLARDLQVWAAQTLDVRVLARRMSERFDGCWTFVSDGLVGATPELLVRRSGPAIESIVLAGSIGRGRELDEDKRLGEMLLSSHKDQVEHELAAASVVERLASVCSDVSADPAPWLLRLANVQHLATRVTATLADDASALQLAGALHPTAAVCGTPRRTAMELIRSDEGIDRGRYSGPVGWVDADGNGEFGVALRCAQVTGQRARLFAGAGIVGESLPELELEETRLKLRAMQSALEVTTP